MKKIEVDIAVMITKTFSVSDDFNTEKWDENEESPVDLFIEELKDSGYSPELNEVLLVKEVT